MIVLSMLKFTLQKQLQLRLETVSDCSLLYPQCFENSILQDLHRKLVWNFAKSSPGTLGIAVTLLMGSKILFAPALKAT